MNPEYPSVEARLESGARTLGIAWSPDKTEKFRLFQERLIEKNKQFNLTGITDPLDICEKHFLDSLSLVKAVDLSTQPLKVADVGTGAGFPGIPLAIVFPNLNITLIDSTGKKIRFVEEMIKELGLSNATAVLGRAEELGRPGAGFHKAFDIVVARAVAKLDVLLGQAMPLVKPGGSLIAMKSQNCDDEIALTQKISYSLGISRLTHIDFTLPGTDLARRLIVAKSRV